MQKIDSARLRHMLDAATEVEGFSQRKTRRSLDTELNLVLALIKSIKIIVESAANVTDKCRDHLPKIFWPNIIGMRNRLVHAYFDINLDILWKTVIEDIPPLIAELEKIVKVEQGVLQTLEGNGR